MIDGFGTCVAGNPAAEAVDAAVQVSALPGGEPAAFAEYVSRDGSYWQSSRVDVSGGGRRCVCPATAW